LNFFFSKNYTTYNIKTIDLSKNVKKNNSIAIHSKKNENYFNDYINFFFRNGLKKKIKLQLLKSFNFFFLFFYCNNMKHNVLQSKIDILKNSFFLNFNFFKINLILEFLINFLNPIFDIECHDIPKKYKKKAKKQFSFKIKYLNYNLRKKRALK
jgi:hypothetical protein